MEPIPYRRADRSRRHHDETYNARRSYEIAAVPQRGVPVIMGGVHPTFVPEEAEQHADSLFLGDAETMWATVVEDVRRAAAQPRYSAPRQAAARCLTRRDMFKGKGYLPISLVQFAAAAGSIATSARSRGTSRRSSTIATFPR